MIVSEETARKKYTITMDVDDDNEILMSYSTGKIIHVIQEVCKSFVGYFTVEKIDGGYIYEDGVFKRRNCFVMSFLDTDKKTIDEMAADLCAFFGCDSLEISSTDFCCHTVSEKLEN